MYSQSLPPFGVFTPNLPALQNLKPSPPYIKFMSLECYVTGNAVGGNPERSRVTAKYIPFPYKFVWQCPCIHPQYCRASSRYNTTSRATLASPQADYNPMIIIGSKPSPCDVFTPTVSLVSEASKSNKALQIQLECVQLCLYTYALHR